MSHLETGRYESMQANWGTPWDRWIAALEKRMGHSLDGDQQLDGYSLDFAYDMYKASDTVEQAALIFGWKKEQVNNHAAA